jgi:hypothetical protein
MSDFQALDTLRNAGIPVDAMPADERSVLESLSQDEVNTLISVNTRLRDAGGDVEGHRASDTGYVFF